MLLLVIFISVLPSSLSQSQRKGKQFAAENSEDPFVVGISPEFEKL